jgi:hypothetical protein
MDAVEGYIDDDGTYIDIVPDSPERIALAREAEAEVRRLRNASIASLTQEIAELEQRKLAAQPVPDDLNAPPRRFPRDRSDDDELEGSSSQAPDISSTITRSREHQSRNDTSRLTRPSKPGELPPGESHDGD